MMFCKCNFRSLLLALVRTRITKAGKDKRRGETNNLAMLIGLYCHSDSIATRLRKKFKRKGFMLLDISRVEKQREICLFKE